MIPFYYIRRLFIFLILSTFSLTALADNIRDTAYLKSELLIANGLLTNKPDSAIIRGTYLLGLCEEIKYTRGIATASALIGKAYSSKADYKNELIWYQRSLKAREDAGESAGAVEMYGLIMRSNYIAGNYTEIGGLYNKAIRYFSQPAITPLMKSMVWFFQAQAQYEFGHYDSVAYYDQKIISLLAVPDVTTYKMLYRGLASLGSVAERADENDKAIAYHHRAADVARQFKDTFYMTNALVNIGKIFRVQKKYDKSKEIGMNVLQIARPLKQWINIAAAAQLVSDAFTLDQNTRYKFDSALVYAKEGYAAVLNYGAFTYILNHQYELGKAYINVKDFKSARDILLPAIKIAREKGQLDNMVNGYSYLSEAYHGLNDDKEAYRYRVLYSSLKDSLRGNENTQRVVEIEAKYETAEKNKQLAEQKLVIASHEHALREKNLQITIIAGGILLLSGLIFLIYRNNKNKQEITLLRGRIEGAGNERVRLGKELHDGIVSQLLGIKLALEHVKDDKQTNTEPDIHGITGQLDAATRDLRNTAHNLMPESLLRNGLAEALTILCDNTCKNTGLPVDFQAYGPMGAMNKDLELSMYRIAQELLQNALKHAQPSNILIQLTRRNSLLTLTVEDDGIGMTKNGSDKQTLSSVRQRVDEIGGQLDIRSSPGEGTTIYIEFNMTGWNHLSDKLPNKSMAGS